MPYVHTKRDRPPAKPVLGGGGRGPTRDWPGGGGGGRGGGGDEFPSYRERLRRYRLLIGFVLTSVVMIFVAFTSAYVVRKAGLVWDPARSEYISNWVPATLPVKILLINTFILLLSSLTLEVARRRAEEDVALAPIADIPGYSREPWPFPSLVMDHDHAWPCFPWWAVPRVGAASDGATQTPK